MRDGERERARVREGGEESLLGRVGERVRECVREHKRENYTSL